MSYFVRNASDVKKLRSFSITEVEKKIPCRGLADVFWIVIDVARQTKSK